jgi:hypothetical protein
MSIYLIEEYFASIAPDTITFADEAAYARWAATQK